MGAAPLRGLASMPPSGGESDVEPIDALLFCVRREAARGVGLRLRLELLDPDGSAISDPAAPAAGPHRPLAPAAELHRLEAQATERLARFSKMALDAGVAERKVWLVARQAEALAHAFTTALDQHPTAVEMSVAERAELVRLFAAQLALLESDAGDVEGQAREVG